MKTIERVYADQGEQYFRPQIAVVDGDLPDGALALVIRNPASPGEPIVVLSRGAVHFDALFRARAALDDDARRSRHPEVQRVLYVAKGGRVTVEQGGSRESFMLNSLNTGSAQSGDLLARLTRSATSMTDVSLPGIGRGLLLRFQ